MALTERNVSLSDRVSVAVYYINVYVDECNFSTSRVKSKNILHILPVAIAI